MSEMTHTFYWGNNSKRETLKGRECKVLASAKMNSILIEFENGQRECVSRRSVRRKPESVKPNSAPQMRLF